MAHRRFVTLTVASLLALATGVTAQIAIESFEPVPNDPVLELGTYTHPAGGATLDLSIGVGSGAFRSTLGDRILGRFLPHRPGTYWTVSDRGPNFQCEEAPAVIGVAQNVACPAEGAVAAGAGRLYPRADVGPAIFLVQLRPNHTVRILDIRPLRGRDGAPISGLPNPLTVASTEVPRDGAGRVIARDASGLDAEGIVHVPLFGGRFLIVEENGPSVLEVAENGTVLTRFVPAGTETDYTQPGEGLAPARYAVAGSLPAILAKRRLNRGLESIAMSHDPRHVYVMLQSPLEHPNASARDSFNIRILKLRVHWRPRGSSLEPVGEWVYRLAPVAAFQAQGATDAGRQRDLRVSEMLWVRGERFLVLERTDQVTMLFEIDLSTGTNILGSAWDALATSPSLEQIGDLATVNVTPVTKTLRLVASSLETASPRFPPKLEGLAFAPDGRLMVINDDDFGITGQKTQINLIDGLDLR